MEIIIYGKESAAKMKLIIGGYAQGKLTYAIQQYAVSDEQIYDAALPNEARLNGETVIINHFHQWVRTSLSDNGCPEQEILSFLEKYDKCVIISDEIGNGIVPIEPFEREYRERVGNILITLAKRADEVVRVVCGIGQKIK